MRFMESSAAVAFAGSLLLGLLSCREDPTEAAEGTVCDTSRWPDCDSCYGSLYRCEYEGVEVTEQSCNGCQAEARLYQELCDSGSDALISDIDPETVCVIVGSEGAY